MNESLEVIELNVKEDESGIRIDKYIVERVEDYTRTYIQKLIQEEHIYVNDKKIKSNYKVREKDRILIHIPHPKLIEIKGENIPLEILYEDDDLLIINKDKDMVVHPASGHYSGTLVNGLLYYCKGHLSDINGDLRPGIVHRLDKNTTGALIVCKNNDSHLSIAKQLKDHTLLRKYNAIVYYTFKEEDGTIDAPIGRHPIERKKMAINYENGRDAVTHYHVLENFKTNFSHVECRLETGRTHQIRVHMASISHPLVGDDIYGPKHQKSHLRLNGQALHASKIGFIHPTTNKYMEVEAPLPEYFIKLINKLR